MVKSIALDTIGVEPYVPPPPPKKATSLRWTKNPPHEVETGKSFTMELLLEDVSMTVAPMPLPLAGKSIVLRRNGTPTTGKTGSNGRVGFSDSVPSVTTYTYQAEFLGDDVYRGCDEGDRLDLEAEAVAWLSRLR